MPTISYNLRREMEKELEGLRAPIVEDIVEALLSRFFPESLLRKLARAVEDENGELERELWQELDELTRQSYRAGLSTPLERAFVGGAGLVERRLGLSLDVGLIDERAVNWVDENITALVHGLSKTEARYIRNKIQQYLRGDIENLGELINSINATVYNVERAGTIAVTETTRAIASATEAAVDEISAAFPQLALGLMWVTNNDALVCPICSPLDGKLKGHEWFALPPAHTNCRCWVVEVLL